MSFIKLLEEVDDEPMFNFTKSPFLKDTFVFLSECVSVEFRRVVGGVEGGEEGAEEGGDSESLKDCCSSQMFISLVFFVTMAICPTSCQKVNRIIKGDKDCIACMCWQNGSSAKNSVLSRHSFQ